MVEEIQPNQPNWQDITFEDITTCIQKGAIREALLLAKLRLDGIRAAPKEISVARSDSTEIPDSAWAATQQAFIEEIAQLESIIAQLQSEL